MVHEQYSALYAQRKGSVSSYLHFFPIYNFRRACWCSIASSPYSFMFLGAGASSDFSLKLPSPLLYIRLTKLLLGGPALRHLRFRT
jgi:hypothetical protein